MKNQVLFMLATVSVFFIYPKNSYSTTYYVRTDGGSSAQCTGLSDTAYSGIGTNQACAVNHLFWLLTPDGKGGGTAKIEGGDTVIVGPGEYMIGVGAPGSTACNASWGYNCTPPPIPSGPDASHPTVIRGKGWDTKLSDPPQLWGYGRLSKILNLTGSSNVEVRYLEITDHSNCIYNSVDPAKSCNRNSPYTWPYADVGIYATDSRNVLLKDLNIHGISKTGIHAGRLSDWTLEGVTVRASGFTGWDGDVGHGLIGSGTDSSNSGNIVIRDSKIEYSGCGEKYPGTELWGCHGQSQQGQGDGFGTYATEGYWLLENSEFSHNLQDGFDLLYHTGTNGNVTVKNSRFEGNAGNGLKIASGAIIENTAIIGNCDYFVNNPISETYSGSVEACRAVGTPLMTSGWRPGQILTLTNSLLTGSTTVLAEIKSGTNVTKTKEISGSISSITSGNQYATNSALDKIWLRPLGPWNPNDMEFAVVIGTERRRIKGTWVEVGNNVWELSGYRSQTGNIDSFPYVYLGFACDGTARFVSRNNIVIGMESYTKKISNVSGVKSTYQYLDGYDGNGNGLCAAEGTAVVLDNADSIIYNTDIRYPYCPNDKNILCSDPLLQSIPPLSITTDIYKYGERWNISPKPMSPAVGKSSLLPGSTVFGVSQVPTTDMLGYYRPKSSVTWGPVEYNASSPPSAPARVRFK